jgi:hypothetical protein
MKSECFCKEEKEDLMIQCDTCSRWFHAKCIGRNKKNKHLKYYCDNCQFGVNKKFLSLLSKYLNTRDTFYFNTVKIGEKEEEISNTGEKSYLYFNQFVDAEVSDEP